MPVLKARMTSFNPKHGTIEFTQGLLLCDSTTTIKMNNRFVEILPRALFHMHSRVGDSGAGIFSQDGKLLTLNHTGNRLKQATGTLIPIIRKLAF